MTTHIFTRGNADPDAVEIGELYASARCSMYDAVLQSINCGKKLLAKKNSLPRGQWLPWLQANEEELGFGDRTANLLMKAASNPQLTADLNDSTALAISRKIWGNESQPKTPKCEQTGDVSIIDTRTDSKGRQKTARKTPTPPATAPKPTTDSDQPSCSFCGKGPDKVSTLIVSPNKHAAICNECVDLCVDVIVERKQAASHIAEPATTPETKPEMVECPKCHGTGNMDDTGIPEFLRRRPS